MIKKLTLEKSEFAWHKYVATANIQSDRKIKLDKCTMFAENLT